MIKLPEWAKNIEVLPNSKIHNYNHKTTLEEIKNYFQAIWKRVVDWKNYPSDYINLYESQGHLVLYHFKNNLLVHTQDITAEDHDWREYISLHENLPVYLVLQGQDCEFRSLPTNQIRIWDKFLLFNQIKTDEFGTDDLVTHYQSKQHPEKADILVSIRSNERLKQIYRALSTTKNPMGGVISWEIEQSLIMKKQASISRTLRAWIIALTPVDTNTFTILVMHQDKILLQRLVFTKNIGDLEKELRATLRFLQRQGYSEGQAVSILMPENSIANSTFANAELEIIHISKKLLEKEAYKPTKPFLKFVPQTLKQANLANDLPRLAIKFLIPISVILLVLWASVQIKSFFQDYENKWLNTQHEKIQKKTSGNFAEQLHLSKLFANYVNSSSNNPSVTINGLNKMLKGRAQASSITWAPNEQGAEMRLNLPQSMKKYSDLKKYINTNHEKFLGDANLTWDEQGNDSVLLIQQRAGQHDN